MNNNSSPKFLQNSPMGEDLFEGKSQEKIANVVVSILKNENFQIIGIDGGWGTGKSNLVRIIERKLNEYHFFNYDVWGHQEDDQRKAILVELTEFVSDKNRNIVTDKKKWNEKLKKLLAKEKEITTINRPYLSVGFIFSLFSIIYVPSVNVFKDTLVDFFNIEQLFWKLILVLLPIFIVLGIYIYHLVNFWSKKSKFLESFQLASQETFQVYTNKQKVETKIETISENEPSVKDFRNWMSEIDSDLGEKKLILVFDNFDRLPKRHILSIWSSIHIFFSEKKYVNIKIIIPFDRNHIKNAFKDLNGDNTDYANDYINKTFDLVYRVSPPILSDWKSFLKKCWNNAFENFDEEEYIKIEQIYEVFRSTITPREIIAFVNEVVSIKLLNNSIPDKYVSLFVINKEVILADPLKAIIDSTFLEGLSYLYKDDEKFQNYITALAYQIDPTNALDVVYRKQLKNCLLNNQIENFVEITKTNAFNKIIQPTLSELENFENPILVLENINEDSKISNIERQAIWDNIYLKVKNHKFPYFAIKEFQKILLKNISPTYKEEWLNTIISSLLESNEFDAVEYSNLITDLNEFASLNSVEVNVYNFLNEKSVSVDQFIQLVIKREEKFEDYKITCLESELDLHLASINIDKLEDAYFVKHLSSLNFKLEKFKSSLKENVSSNKSNTNNLSKIYKVLKYISNETFGLLLTDVDLHQLFPQLNVEDELYTDIVSMRLVMGKKFNQSLKPTFAEILNSEDEQLVENITKGISFYIGLEDFLIRTISFDDSLLCKAVVRKIIKLDIPTNFSSLNSLLINFEDICSTNLLNPQEFIQYLDKWSESNLEDNLVKLVPNYYFQEAKKIECTLSTKSINLVMAYFNGLTKEDWNIIFNDLECKEIKLLEIISYSDWNSYSLEALKEKLVSIAKSAVLNNESILKSIIESFENSNKDLTNSFKDVRDEFIASRNMTSELFLFFSNWLFKYASLEEKSSDVLRTIFKAELLDDDSCVDLLLSNANLIKAIVRSSPTSDSSDLKAGIKDRRANDIIKEFGKLTGLN